MLDFKYSADPNAHKPLVNNSGPWPYLQRQSRPSKQVIDGGFAVGQRAAGRSLPRRGPLTSAAISAPVAPLEVMYCCVLSRPLCTLIPRCIERSVS